MKRAIEQVECVKWPFVGKVHYLRHHGGVHRDALTTKLRVAYYASSRPTKHILSLNDFFCSGPAIIPVTFRVLLRFREKMIALKVSYMYCV